MKRQVLGALFPSLLLQALSLGDAFGRDDLVPGSRYTAARPTAMGDTCIGMSEDTANALFCNPSGLPKVRGLRAEPANISLFSGLGIVSALNLNLFNVINLDNYKSQLQSMPGTPMAFGGAVLPSVSWRFIAIGILLQSELGAVESGGNITYHTRYELIPAANLSYRFASGIVKIGYSLQWVNKSEGKITRGVGETMAWNDGIAQGGGLSHTAGASLTLPVTYLPSLNIVARNILGTTYSLPSILPLATNSSGFPATEPMTLDASIGVTPKFGTGYYANLVVAMRDIIGTSGQALFGRFGMGIELMLGGRFALRGGFAGGFPSAGIGYKHKGGEFNASYSTQTLGSSYLSSPESRIMIQYQLYGSTSGNK